MSMLSLIGRESPIFESDLEEQGLRLNQLVAEGRHLVIGGAGTIGQAVTKEIFKRDPKVLHVVDISHKNASQHVEVVEKILKDLNLTSKPRILALNKVDLLGSELDPSFLTEIDGATAVLTSTESGVGLDQLLEALEDVVDVENEAGASPAIRVS